MTASRSRRRSSTILALVVSILALVAVGVFGVIGARTLADSTAGQLADGQKLTMPLQRLPFTPTALIGVVDDDGRLTSAAVGVLEPDGVGGSLIVLAASADASSGNNTVLVPLDAELELNGPTAFREAAERLTGLSFDVVEIVDQRRFVQIVTPLGDLPTLMPFALRDSSTDERWEAGELVLSSASAARALTARNDSIADWYLEPNRVAVWEAVADRVGAGVGSVAPIASDRDLPEITTLDEFVRRLFAAPVDARALSFVVIDENRLDEELSDELASAFGRADIDAVVAHNRSETLMLFGAIAPGRLGAPIDGPTFRIVSGYADADLADLGLNRSDVLKHLARPAVVQTHQRRGRRRSARRRSTRGHTVPGRRPVDRRRRDRRVRRSVRPVRGDRRRRGDRRCRHRARAGPLVDRDAPWRNGRCGGRLWGRCKYGNEP